MAASREFLLQQYFHAALPRNVPGEEDRNLFRVESALLDRMIAAIKVIAPFCPLEHQSCVNSVRLALTTSKALNVEGKIDRNLLVKELKQLERSHSLILYVTEQNAALLVYKYNGDYDEDLLVFEACETSAVCEKVLATKHALQWDFPGHAVSVPPEVYSDDSFVECLAAFLEQASIESVKQFAAVTYKASAPMPEIRDTTDPALITGLLMTILDTNGATFLAPILRKRVHDTVSFKQARKPWRRSPFYLVIRVAVQRHLYRALGAELGHTYYKTIMSIFLSRLLDDCLGTIPPEASHYLKQKLGRRLAKLEQDRMMVPDLVKKSQEFMFSGLLVVLEKSLATTSQFLEEQWTFHKMNTQRIIRPLPQHADSSEIVLQLLLSRHILNEVAFGRHFGSQTQTLPPLQHLEHYEHSRAKAKPFAVVADRYLTLAKRVEQKVAPVKANPVPAVDLRTRCCELAETIESYVSATGNDFDGYAELKSGFILDLMELWVEMDRNASTCYPLLGRYHPGFNPEVLDTLELLSLDEMKRVQRVQAYLGRRCQGWDGIGSKTIFDDPAEDSFAVMYYDTDTHGLKELRQKIESKAAKAREAKESEWRELSKKHEELMQRVAESSCPYITIVASDGTLVREHSRGCLKHKYKWQAKQIKITTFESPLPNVEPSAKAAIFELACPDAFAAYRDATWTLLATFSYPKTKAVDNVPLLRSYSGLVRYATRGVMKVSLGSTTKSHLDCHYAVSGFPVALNQICRPCGLTLKYYDTSTQTWTIRTGKPSFSAHCPLALPHDSPYQSLRLSHDCMPSSNDVLASQTKCPSDLNVHEFMAWQGLLCGTHCRWLSLLRELGATNLNFSTESTWAIISKLIFQLGPSSFGQPLRDVHAIFNDSSFCRKLLEQIGHRIEAIRRNWREPVQMNVLITILLKMASLSPSEDIQAKTSGLITLTRAITWDWCAALQSSANDDSREATIFAIWASVLCKRTFQMFAQSTLSLTSDALHCFVGASIILQENLVGRFELLPLSLRNAVLRDLLYTYKMRSAFRKAIIADHNGLLSALDDIWPVPDGFLDSPPQIQAVPGTWWIEVSMKSGKQQLTHCVHYNVIRGDLLINGKQSGTLPAEYRQDPIIHVLFGTQNLRVLPSYQPGMSIFVAQPMPYKHRIHLGFRRGQLIVRATQGYRTLELIRSDIFRNGSQYDLPSPLIENCYHWLDLDSGVLEIRQDDIWKSKNSNWMLNLRTRHAMRRNSTLVDPYSPVAKKIAQNFFYFEYAHHVTVFEPHNGRLSVELKRLELSFFVNSSRLLQCRQLGAEIAPTNLQDPGVWYGLRSKIVLRSTTNPRQRSILAPAGPIKVRKDGDHVLIFVENDGTYLNFDINEVLGRVECPAEPLLLYTKALWHAYTAHFLPDPLTGRTGLEEAMYLLQSGLYQPWKPLPETHITRLLDIAKLSPRRFYYPTSMKCMETVEWDRNLTTTIQDDRYRAIIEQICHRSSQLLSFDTTSSNSNPLACPPGDPHLEARAMSRSGAVISARDHAYKSRDGQTAGLDRANVAIISRLLAEWPSKLSNTKALASLLQEFPVIGGHVGAFDRIQIFDLISANLGENWGSLVQFTSQSKPEDKYRLMFQLAPMAFSVNAKMDLLRVILSFAQIHCLKDITPPIWPSYLRFQAEEVPAVKDLAELMNDAKKPHVTGPSGKQGKPGQLALARLGHEEKSQRSCVELAKSILAQWPSVEVKVDKLASIDSTLLDTEKALELVLCEWGRIAQNFEFSQYLEAVQLVLNEYSAAETHTAPDLEMKRRGSLHHGPPQASNYYPSRARGGERLSLHSLLGKSIRSPLWACQSDMEEKKTEELTDLQHDLLSALSNKHPISPHPVAVEHLTAVIEARPAIQELKNILSKLRASASSVQRRYGLEMEQSIDALVKHISQPPVTLSDADPTLLEQEIQHAWKACTIMLRDISQALAEGDRRARWLRHAGLWPKITLVTLLSELRSTSETAFGDGTKEALVELGLKITALQRLLRIQDAAKKNKQQQLYDETVNPGHLNWSPLELVDWLILEIDSDFMLRVEQVEVANATISPESGQNSVVQLLMGKGKTSCILPMVAAVLADKRNLVRVIVPRPLLLQSAQIMQIRLGGLLSREIMHIPFSRKTPTNCSLIQTFGQLHVNLKRKNGIMLALPEHILSFKLSGIQRLCDDHVEEATTMIKFQGWLDRYARDVLDESDVSLAIRTQLIYPSGSQMTVDGHPQRWRTVQAVLQLLRFYLSELERRFPQSIAVVERAIGDYPLIYFLRQDVQEHLVAQIVEDICKGQLGTFPCAEIPASGQEDIRLFVSSPVISSQVLNRVTGMFKEKQHLLKVLYLLRGLFVHRIFLSTLKKRWNVQYGLHPTRDPIAVPYHAKGVPSPTSEWGHPDVAIILTCLSFYYQGLDLGQFKKAFEHLLKSDEPSIEYEKWATHDLPESLRDYNAINVENSSQLRELHYYIRFNVYLLDFYLNSFVFPGHARQFDTKIQASGWDLVLYHATQKSLCRTSGFSGTNDSRHQLPMMIKQNDLPKLAHTNAEVLSYLLEPRNRQYIPMVGSSGRRLSEEGLLQMLLNPCRHPFAKQTQKIRILIDAGAQILEHDNYSLAKAWLKIDWEAAAAVFFESDHRPWVLYPKGKKIPLVASPFAEDMEGCLVYLDESHCRGTDLKLPPSARAALTLGPHVTKDALAQAAMRLRLLGQSQAVTFFSPPEVHQSILDLRKKSEGSWLDSSDVIAWLLEQSCNALEQSEPLFFMQGNSYLQQVQAKIDNPDYLERLHQRDRFLSVVRSKELHTLKELYEPKRLRRAAQTNAPSFHPSLKKYVNELAQRKEQFQDRGIAIHSSALEEVEQEREVEFEVESVRDIQKPVHFTALKIPKLHRDLEEFVKSGRITDGSNAYQPMFSTLQKTAAGLRHGEFSAPSRAPGLFVSTQFSRTVKVTGPNDNFLRPCHWILWSSRTQMALVISPEEADALIPLLRRYRGPKDTAGITHLIVYSAPVTRRMLHFNNLDYHATPPLPSNFKTPAWLKIELGIFAGRLYFEWREYQELSTYLGVKTSADSNESSEASQLEAFVKKPCTFLREWLAVLRKNQDFEHTPMGFVTTGKPLSSDHPFFLATARRDMDVECKLKKAIFAARHADEAESDDDGDHDDDELFHYEDGHVDGHGKDEHVEDGFDEETNTFFNAGEYI
ncbi:uncharacterized protein BDZ99DRAFT_454339 [Mytilinidion resinicola]|uniref:ubiquitinyl hydrolase 1 n=1 Tax=Mytilinidion resinicola TaxID=574789 RepID=A0A6A6Y4F6_9PEZI|nr:uncharacterized protein BDZ99DRAFT_454339 [Mytilinidion resinicola]KAF2802677.1 hypothetical protein BDZ99DRAFT_454339 [Mytilinidion resinicola]